MKTRVLSMMMCVVMLLGVFAVAVSAMEKPKATNELEVWNSLPSDYASLDRISENLTSSSFNTPDYYGARTPFTDAQKADIADMSKYGISAYGIAASERALSYWVDGVWSQGSGAFACYSDDKTYNMYGETGKEDSIYQMVVTMNFGSEHQMDYLTFFAGINQVPGAADIFVSDDGKTWTSVGYYDLIQKQMDGFNLGWFGGSLFIDELGGSAGGLQEVWIDLGDNVTGQYLRICATALRKADNFSATNSYEANVNQAGQIQSREMIVFGKNLDNEGAGDTETDDTIKPVADKKLKIHEQWPEDFATMNRISEGLTSYGGYTKDYWGNRTPFTDAEKAEMADMSKYGITAYGIAATERALSVMTDGYFNNNGSPIRGSYGFYGDDQTYNFKGETGKEDSIYQTIITMNFGKVCNLEYLTFLSGNNQIAAAADLYISNDGENWTAIGYYDVLEDLIAMVKEGTDNNVGIWGGPVYNLTDLNGEKSGGTGTNFNHVWIDLGEGVQAKYLRICNTTAALIKTGTAVDGNNYAANLSNTTQVCGREMIVYGSAVECAEHAWDEGKVTSEPTHAADGVKTFTCSKCLGTKTEPIAKQEHTYSTWQKHDAAQHKKTCDCGDVQYAAHAWDAGKVTTEPTHVADGVKTFTCTDCGETKTEAVAKQEHAYGTAWEKHDAEQHKKACACGDVQYAAHAWDAGKVTTEPTETAEGVRTFTCADCGETKTEAVAKLEAAETTTAEQTTAGATTTKDAATTAAEKKSGCGAGIGGGMFLILMVMGCAVLSFRKKQAE